MNIALLKKRIMETPDMEPADAVKLVFQNELGCGHLCTEESVCAKRVQDELHSVREDKNAPPFTDIGNGLCRLNLHAPAVRILSPMLIARMMTHTAAQVRGTREGLVGQLEQLCALCAQGGLPFPSSALEDYLSDYARQGYPLVSHSTRYHAAYEPAYRVVLRGYGDVLPLLPLMEQHIAADGRAVLALDGPCGSGKSTLAALLAPLWHAAILPMDDFFLPPPLRTPERLASPGGNVHHERFLAEVLTHAPTRAAFCYQRFDCHAGLLRPVSVPAVPVWIIEGSYSHHPAFASAYELLRALRVLLEVDPGVQLTRLKKRNEAMLPRFVSQWIPLEKSYLEAYDIVRKADLVLRSDPWEEDGA